MKKLLLSLAAVAVMSTAQATYINGALTISGGAVLDSSVLGSATQVNSWDSAAVTSRSGDFLSIPLYTAVTMTAPWTFNSGPHAALWNVGGFTFDLLSSAVVNQSSTFLSVSGTGAISGNGFSATFGTFNFSTQEDDAGGVFSFSSANSATGRQVPDGGMTVVLIGVALAGAGLLRRKLT